jgi:eukaryotic-like serine/threonine-protein kinase
MNADQWGQVADLFQQSIALPEPDRQAFLLGSPYSDEVRDQVARLLVGDAGAEERGFLQPLGPDDVTGVNLPDPHAAARRGLHLRCPHCHHQIEVIETRIPGEFTCQLCGKTIRTGDGSTGPIEPGQGETIRWEPSAALRKFGRFALIHWVGEGGYGIVYKARDPGPLDRIVALKIPRLKNLGSPQDRDLFLRDAQAAGQLRHSSIVPIFEVGEVEGTPYIVSEFVEGVTLAELLSDPGPAPDFRESARIAVELAGALQHAHDRRVVHRDVKPSNIMIDRQGRPRLMDFGLAKMDASEITIAVTGRPMGTPAYMSPEQARGEGRHVDGRTDVYGLGAVLYFLITGSAPFAGTERMIILKVIHDDPPSPRSLNDRIPRDLQTICQKAMAKEPSRRYASAKDLADDLQNYLNNRPITARPVGKLEKAWRLCARNPRLSAAIGTAVAAIVAVAIVSTMLAVSTSRAATARTRELCASHQQLALELLERGEIGPGLLWLERALNLANGIGDADLAHSVETNLATWSREHPPLRTVFAHPTEVRRSALSPDGKSLLAASADGTFRLWNVASGEPILGPIPHGGKIRSARFRPDGLQFLIASEDGSIRLWDASTGREADPKLAASRFELWDAVFGDAGATIVSLGQDGTFRRWNSATGQPLGPVVGKSCMPTSAAISPDGRKGLVASVTETSREVRLWDLVAGTTIGPPLEHSESVWASAFSPDGKIVATGSGDSQARLWDTSTAARLGPTIPFVAGLGSLVFSPDGTALLSSTGEKTSRLWEVASGLPRGDELQSGTRTSATVFSPDGTLVATGGEDGRARLWDARTGKPLGHPMPHLAAVSQLAFLPDSRSILTGSGEKVVRIWSIDVSTASSISLAVPGKVVDAALSPDGSLVAAGNDLGDVYLCKSADGQPIGPPWKHGEAVEVVAIADDGRTILIGGRLGRVQLRRVADGQPVGPVHSFKGQVVAAAFSRDSSTAVVGSDDGTALVIDAGSGRARGAALAHGGRVQRVAVNASGSVVVTGSTDNSVRLWNGASGTPIGQPLPHVGDVVDLALSPDGSRLITADLEGPARLWDVGSSRPIFPFDHVGRVITVGFSPDGRTALTGGYDAKVRLWDVNTGQRKKPVLSGLGAAAFAAAFSHDNRLVAIGGQNGNVRLWDASKGIAVGPRFGIADYQVHKLAFHPRRDSLLSLSDDGVARLWTIPQPAPEGASGLTGLELDERDEVVPLDGPTLRKLRASKTAAKPSG